jgi:DNA-binding NarL/FixJ family response regulator
MSGRGPEMSRRAHAGSIGGAAAAMACYFLVARPPGPNAYLIFYLGTPAVGLAFLAAGIAARLRWPSSRLGLLFSLAGYLTLLPALDYLNNSAAFTAGNAALPFSGAVAVHLGLAWPTGRLRSRFERGVVIAEYASAIGFSLLGMLFWDPAFSGCDAACPANLLLVRGSRPAWDAVNETGAAASALLTVVVVVLIVGHWRSARGWSRQAMAPLVRIALVIGAESLVTDVTGLFRLPPLANLVFNGWAPLVNLLGPVLFVISTVRARTAHGALGTAIVDLEPGAPPGRLRDTLARALGDSTLQLAFRDGDGFTDTAGLAVDPARPDPGRAVVPLTGAQEAVLVYDGGLDLEPHLVRLTAAAASMALEHSRLQAEVQAQLELVRASRARIVEAGDAERRRLERDLHDGAQQRLVTLTLALGMARSHVAGVDPELEALIDAAGKEAKEAPTELRELARGIHPAVLTETGLAGAVQALVERSPAVVTITGVPRERRAAGGQPARRRDQAGGGHPVSVTPADGRLRVVIAEDAVLLREGLRRVLTDAGLDVAGVAGDAAQLLRLVAALRPGVVLADIRMPPSQTTEGLEAALEIRRRWPGTAVIVLSQHVETEHLFELLAGDARGIGYVLKERVADIAQFTGAIRRVAAGESVIDPQVVARLVARPRQDSPLQTLTERELAVLALMAEGRSNQAIAGQLFMSPKTVETHVGNMFGKLGLLPAAEDHRRVLAVLTYLRR